VPTRIHFFVRLTISVREALKVSQILIIEWSLVTGLQVTACVFGSPYAFHLIAEGLTVCSLSVSSLYDLPFCRYKALKWPTLFLIFWWCWEHVSQMLFTTYCQTIIFTAKRLWKFGCEYRSANYNSPTRCGVHFPTILSNYNGTTAYICRLFVLTMAFLVVNEMKLL